MSPRQNRGDSLKRQGKQGAQVGRTHKRWNLQESLTEDAYEPLTPRLYAEIASQLRTSPIRRHAIISALIGITTAGLVAAISGLLVLTLNFATASRAPSRGTSIAVFVPQRTSFSSAVSELESSRESKVDMGINDLYFIYETAGPALRRRIISILVKYIHAEAPPLPNAMSSYAYCLASPPLTYPATVSNALRVIGSREPGDISLKIDLSGINLAYASLSSLDFQNVNFDNDLLCRAIFYSSGFKNASFDGACLRFAIIADSAGLTAAQLQEAYSLYKVRLPAVLTSSRRIEDMVREDPALQPGFGS